MAQSIRVELDQLDAQQEGWRNCSAFTIVFLYKAIVRGEHCAFAVVDAEDVLLREASRVTQGQLDNASLTP